LPDNPPSPWQLIWCKWGDHPTVSSILSFLVPFRAGFFLVPMGHRLRPAVSRLLPPYGLLRTFCRTTSSSLLYSLGLLRGKVFGQECPAFRFSLSFFFFLSVFYSCKEGTVVFLPLILVEVRRSSLSLSSFVSLAKAHPGSPPFLGCPPPPPHPFSHSP